MNESRLNQYFAWTLLSVYALFGASWILHHAFSSEHRHGKEVCTHQLPGDDRPADTQCDDECLICSFAPTFAELCGLQDLFFVNTTSVVVSTNFGEKRCHSVATYTLSQPRAPPARKAHSKVPLAA